MLDNDRLISDNPLERVVAYQRRNIREKKQLEMYRGKKLEDINLGTLRFVFVCTMCSGEVGGYHIAKAKYKVENVMCGGCFHKIKQVDDAEWRRAWNLADTIADTVIELELSK